MRVFLALALAGLFAACLSAGGARGDVPPPYEEFGIGAQMKEAEPFPAMRDVVKGGPAVIAGVKNGDDATKPYSLQNRIRL